MIYAMLIIALSFTLIGFLYRFNVMSPFLMGSLIWVFVFFVGIFLGDEYYSVNERMFFAWSLWFVPGAFLMFIFGVSVGDKKYLTDQRCLNISYEFILCILLIYLWYKIYIIANSYGGNLFLSLRLSAIKTDGFEENLGFLNRIYPIIFSLFIFENIFSNKNNLLKRVILWVFLISFAIAMMSKFTFIAPILGWVIIKSFKNEVSFKYILVIAIISFVGMTTFHFIRAAESDENSLVNFIALYVYSPIVAAHVKIVVASFMPLDVFLA